MKAILVYLTLIPYIKGIIQEEKRPKESQSLTLDTTHEAHTSTEGNNFVHPFDSVDPSVSTIYYTRSKTISKKLTRVHSSVNKN